jgi:hypothetical protein
MGSAKFMLLFLLTCEKKSEVMFGEELFLLLFLRMGVEVKLLFLLFTLLLLMLLLLLLFLLLFSLLLMK